MHTKSRWFLILLQGAFASFGLSCCGSTNEDMLTEFWRRNYPIVESTTGMNDRYRVLLREANVENPNDLVKWLAKDEFREQALYSMLLISDSTTRLLPQTAEMVFGLSTNVTISEAVNRQALELLASRFPREARIANYTKGDLVQFFWRAGTDFYWKASSNDTTEELTSRRSAQNSAYWLYLLGKNSSDREEVDSFYLEPAKAVTSIKVAASQEGGFSMPAPIDNPESFHTLLQAFDWPLFSTPPLNTNCVRIVMGYVQLGSRNIGGKYQLPNYISRGDLKAALEFLIRKSTVDSKYVAAKISSLLASKDPAFASMILWVLNEFKASPTAREALELVQSDPENKKLLLDIQSGRLDKEAAFTKPLAEIYNQSPSRN